MIYLDNAATTKPSKAAVDAMIKAAECFGNPSSLHGLGIEAEKLINEPSRFLFLHFPSSFHIVCNGLDL